MKLDRLSNVFHSIFLICLLLGLDRPLRAQIVADDTLPNNSSITKSNNIFKIDGGTEVGTNLFHSFLDFSLSTNSEAFFNNSEAINNIIGRVTGNNISHIDGLIRANGSSNLFLINPNGFIFGSNAQLDVGGSFLASTADSIQFADGSKFSASTARYPTLLTVSLPVGLNFRQNSAEIRVLGSGNQLTIQDPIFAILERNLNPTGLQVKPGNTLALIGGELNLEGGTITASGGHIELGSVESGFVSLTPNLLGWNLGYEDITNFKNILFSQQALADVSGLNSGSIQIRGHDVTLTDGSVLLSQNLGNEPVGSINVVASNTFKLSGTAPDLRIRSQINTQTLADADGGDVFLSAERVIIQDGARVDTVTRGSGKGGDISVEASEFLELFGTIPSPPTEFDSYTSQLNARTQGSGKAGNIQVSTDRISLFDGANIVSAANLGTGAGGDVNIQARDLVRLIGVEPLSLFSSSIGVVSLIGGNSGNLTIDTARLILQDGGRVDAATFAFGNAGNVTINASEFVEVSGTAPNSINPSLIDATANMLDPELRELANLPEKPIGDSGSVTINTPRLVIKEGAQVTVRNDGTGNAGNLSINADSIFLNDKAGITASTLSGEGGNINLNVREIVQLRNDSLISTTAFGPGNGGNIEIDTPLLTVFLATEADGSDIIAKAERGAGGNITIDALGIFGIGESLAISGNQRNDIDASSEFGLSGQVEINNTIDPNRGIIQLPETVIDPNSLVAQNPCQRGSQSQFTRSGRGGLPPSINEDLDSQVTQVDLIEPAPLNSVQQKTKNIAENLQPSTSKLDSIVPTRGWIFNDKGEVVLVAYDPSNVKKNQRLKEKIPGCLVP